MICLYWENKMYKRKRSINLSCLTHQEFNTIKQRCRDATSSPVLTSNQITHLYIYIYIYIYIYTRFQKCFHPEIYIYIGAYFCLPERTQACMTKLFIA